MPKYSFIAPFIAALLGACAAIPPDRGLADVQQLVDTRSGADASFSQDEASIAAYVDEMAARELSASGAVNIALVNNPQLRIAYARLGLVAADVYDAARLSNPRLSVAFMPSNASGEASQITAGLVQNFAELILLKPRKALAASAAEYEKFTVAAELFNLAQDVRRAYIDAVAAAQTAELRALTARATGLSAALAQRYFEAGNINRLELSIAESAVSEADLNAATARAEAAARRIDLGRLLGFDSSREWRIAHGLELPVALEDTLPALQQLAVAERLELKAAQIAVAHSADSLQMQESYRYLGEFEAGVEVERETDRSRLLGPTFALELPIFNQGAGRILRARAALEQTEASLADLTIAIDNAVALAHADVLAARQRIEIYRTRFIPSRQDVVARTAELQNFMVVSPFETLRAKTAEYDAYAGYIEAVRDYWRARIALTREVGTALPSAPGNGTERLDIEALTRPPPAHHGHGTSHDSHGPEAAP